MSSLIGPCYLGLPFLCSFILFRSTFSDSQGTVFYTNLLDISLGWLSRYPRLSDHVFSRVFLYSVGSAVSCFRTKIVLKPFSA